MKCVILSLISYHFICQLIIIERRPDDRSQFYLFWHVSLFYCRPDGFLPIEMRFPFIIIIEKHQFSMYTKKFPFRINDILLPSSISHGSYTRSTHTYHTISIEYNIVFYLKYNLLMDDFLYIYYLRINIQ